MEGNEMTAKKILFVFFLLIASFLTTKLIFHYYLNFDAQLGACSKLEDLSKRSSCQEALRNRVNTSQKMAMLEDELGLTDFQRAISDDPEVRRRFELEAKNHFEEAVRLNPSNEQYRKDLENIQELIADKY